MKGYPKPCERKKPDHPPTPLQAMLLSCVSSPPPAMPAGQILCGAGYFSPRGAGVCTPCPRGKYTEVVGSSDCKPCPVQYPSSSLATSNVYSCGCPAGYACSERGPPVLCPRGTYGDPRQPECMPCPTLTFSSAAGAVICQPACPSTFEVTYQYVVLHRSFARIAVSLLKLRSCAHALCACVHVSVGAGWTQLQTPPAQCTCLP
jgi:hypothetical protein